MSDPTDRRSSGFKFDKHISIGHVLTTAIAIIGATVAYTKLEAISLDNQKRIVELAAEVEENRVFQIEQRVRVWNKVNSQQGEISALKERIAELKAGQSYIIRQSNRIIERLEAIPRNN